MGAGSSNTVVRSPYDMVYGNVMSDVSYMLLVGFTAALIEDAYIFGNDFFAITIKRGQFLIWNGKEYYTGVSITLRKMYLLQLCIKHNSGWPNKSSRVSNFASLTINGGEFLFEDVDMGSNSTNGFMLFLGGNNGARMPERMVLSHFSIYHKFLSLEERIAEANRISNLYHIPLAKIRGERGKPHRRRILFSNNQS